MGCFCETCGITQMPIQGGDKIRMFLLIKNKEHYDDSGASCYNTDFWKPFGLPIKGTYDEYGRIVNIKEDAFSDYLLECVKEMLIEVPNRMGEEISKKI